MKWISTEEAQPTEPGHYRVLIAGDAEYLDGHCLYSFDEYQTWFEVTQILDEDNPLEAVLGSGSHDETWSTVLAWYGPIEIPRLAEGTL